MRDRRQKASSHQLLRGDVVDWGSCYQNRYDMVVGVTGGLALMLSLEEGFTWELHNTGTMCPILRDGMWLDGTRQV